jgi:poly(hydroxyalkanoate) depolymerase family esterase
MARRFVASLALSNIGRVSRVGLGIALVTLAGATASCGDATGAASEPVATTSAALSTLTQVSSFGTNPGGLDMFAYVPASMPSNAPLVFALHGCTETASSYENAGWNALADTYKFYLVYPQQTSANNPLECFNWAGEYGNLADITRGQGEAESVAQMVTYMESTYSVDASRVFMTGFSAGAAYAVAMLAMYPDVFAGGASFSGLPFGCANSVASAETCQSGAVSNTAAQWGAFVKNAYPSYTGPLPRISIWQGSSDTTVAPANLTELVSQWTDAEGLSQTPTTSNTVAGFPHDEYADSSGVVRVETYTLTGMGHAVAIDPTNACGTADTYDVAEGICAVDSVAKFLGLEGNASSDGGAGSSSGSDGGVGDDAGGSEAGGSSGGASSGSSNGSSSGWSTSSSSGSDGTSSSGGSSSGAAAGSDAGAAFGDSSQQLQTLGCSASPGAGAARWPGFAFASAALGIALALRRRPRRRGR